MTIISVDIGSLGEDQQMSEGAIRRERTAHHGAKVDPKEIIMIIMIILGTPSSRTPPRATRAPARTVAMYIYIYIYIRICIYIERERCI